MAVYSRQIATAKRMIAAKGALCSWQQITIPIGDDPANPSAGTPVTYPVRIVFFPNTKLTLLSSVILMKGTEIPSGRMMGYMAAVPFTPMINDTVLDTPYGDLALREQNGLDEINVNGESILFLLRFAR